MIEGVREALHLSGSGAKLPKKRPKSIELRHQYREKMMKLRENAKLKLRNP